MDHNDSEKRRKKKRRRCLTLISIIILTLILLTILSVTVFRAKRPITTVNSITLRNVGVSIDTFHLNVNVSLDANITVKNPNKVGFKYTDSSAYLDYRGQVVGQAPIPAGQISAGQTLTLPLTLTVMADWFLSNSQAVISDMVSGTLPLSTRTMISGKVTVVFFKIHVVSSATCNLNVSVSSKSILNNDCKYHTRLS